MTGRVLFDAVLGWGEGRWIHRGEVVTIDRTPRQTTRSQFTCINNVLKRSSAPAVAR